MAGCSPAAAKRNGSMSQRRAFQIALHGMLSIKPQDIKISLYKIQTGCRCLFNRNLPGSRIFNPDTPCNDIVLFQNTVQQMYFNLCVFICKDNFQCLCFLFVCPDSRKSLQPVFTVSDLIALKKQICAFHPFFIFDIQRDIAVIPGAKGRILLWQRIQRIGAVHAGCIRISGKSAVCIG